MARFEFREDDGDDDTDCDKNYNGHFQRHHYGEEEEGEIIEDESFGNDMAEINDYGDGEYSGTINPNYNREMNDDENYHNDRFPEDEDETHYVQKDNAINSDRNEGNGEYRLIASTKYDRNYERSDFYPSGIHSNNSNESNNSNLYTNPVSDDDEHDAAYDHGPNSDRYQKEGSNRFRHHSNEVLVRSSSHQMSSNGAPEVHYHIYVSDRQASRWFNPSENNGPPRLSQEENLAKNENGTRKNKRSVPLWKKITLWAAITQLLVFLLGRYDLVTLSPPPSYLTWEEYRSHQFRLVHKVSQEGFTLLRHLTSNAFSNNSEDENATFLSPRYAFPKVWKSFVPLQGIEEFGRQNSGSRKTVIFGQEEALEHLRNGLSLWSSSQKAFHLSKRGWRRENQPSFELQNQPLIVYASGGRGIGKGSLAYLLLEQLESYEADTDATSVLDECAVASAANKVSAEATYGRNNFQHTVEREYYCPLLHLTPSDYRAQNQPVDYLEEVDDAFYNNNYDDLNMDMTDSDSSLSSLYRKILDHVVAAGGGASIVVLEKVDSPNLPFLWLSDLMDEIRSHQSIFGNTIFVLTSQIGTDTVEKWTRKRLQSLHGAREAPLVVVSANAEVESLLRYELKRHHAISSKEDDARDTFMGIESWLLVPMAPLDKNAMTLILKDIASGGQNSPFFGRGKSQSDYTASSTRQPMLLTESSASRILDTLEWHQWIHKTSGEVLRIWSPDGAPPLLELWEERVLQSIASLSNCPIEISSKKKVLVLDFEGSATDRLVLRSCELAEEEDDFDLSLVKSDNGRRWKCLGASCSFYL